ncbi:MAG: DUF4238 domain-containing protein [Verrucomicrobiota bacterium]
MSKSKRHHYLPRFYLSGFAEEGQLSVYDRVDNRYRKGSPKNEGLIGHYYSVENEDGERDAGIELILSKIEGNAKTAIDLLTDSKPLSADDRYWLSIFSALFLFRTPEFESDVNEVQKQLIKSMMRTSFASNERARREIEEFNRKNEKPPEVDPEDFAEFVQSDQFEIEMHRNSSLSMVLPIAREVADILYQQNWMILHNLSSVPFLTCDAPFLVIPPSDFDPHSWHGVGMMAPGSKRFVPLSQNVGLLMLEHGGLQGDMKITLEAEVNAFNAGIASLTKRYLFGPKGDHLREIVEQVDLPNLERSPRLRMT